MVDRDELAARCLASLLSNSGRTGRASDYAEDAVEAADALLAALTPPAAAPVAAPVEAKRPEWGHVLPMRQLIASTIYNALGGSGGFDSLLPDSRRAYLDAADAVLEVLPPPPSPEAPDARGEAVKSVLLWSGNLLLAARLIRGDTTRANVDTDGLASDLDELREAIDALRSTTKGGA